MRDATSHCNWEAQLLALHLKPEAPTASGIVTARLISLKGPSKIYKKKKRGERTPAQLAYNEKVKALKRAVYGTGVGRKAKGAWSISASDILRAEHNWMAKFDGTRLLTEKVMGSKYYHPHPVALTCPFIGDGCCDEESCRRLNCVGAISQLYSHWQEQHKGNPAARQLEDRWRLALKHPTKDKEWLDAKEIEGGYAQPLELSSEWMEQQGGVDQGYEQVRPPLAPDADEMFSTFNFKLHSDEHRAWLEAEGTL